MSIQFLYEGRLEYFQKNGFEVTCVCAPSSEDEAIRARGLKLHTIPLSRSVSPLQDIKSIIELAKFFRKEKFDLIELGTPKAALLGSIAGRLAGSKRIVHFILGLVYESFRGKKRFFYERLHRLTCALCHHNLCVSRSMIEEMDKANVWPKSKSTILGEGSCNGINIQEFHPDLRNKHLQLRQELGIPENKIIFGSLGRLAADKGIESLGRSFLSVAEEFPAAQLLLAGEIDSRDPVPLELIESLKSHPQVTVLGFQEDRIPTMAIMDVFVLASRREGLPTVLLESGALGIPAITTTATGCRDMVSDGRNGLVVEIDDQIGLKIAMKRLLTNPVERDTFGVNARKDVCDRFEQNGVWRRTLEYYSNLIKGKTIL